MSATVLRDAAEARRSAVAARVDRPVQRSNQEALGGSARMFAKVRDISLREVENPDDTDESLPVYTEFRGVASVTETPYEMYDWYGPYNEVMESGAFADSLARADLDTPLVIGHDQIRRIARTLNGTLDLSETDEGLVTVARMDPADKDVEYISPKMASGLIDEMSFAFRITAGIWSPDYTEFRIKSVDIHRGDVSIVGYGANPYTSAGVRKAEPVTSRGMSFGQLLVIQNR